MNQKAYLASQAWFTTLFSLALTHFVVEKWHIAFFSNLVPGISVTLSHGVIILIAMIGIPSLAEVRLDKTLNDARKKHIAMRDSPGTSPEIRAKCQAAIDEIDLAILAKSKVKIEACQQEHADSVKS